MNARTKFKKWYLKLPLKARTELVYDFTRHPMTLQVCAIEIFQNTDLGKQILDDLGFTDDKKHDSIL